jgi:hypothetical protein
MRAAISPVSPAPPVIPDRASLGEREIRDPAKERRRLDIIYRGFAKLCAGSRLGARPEVASLGRDDRLGST